MKARQALRVEIRKRKTHKNLVRSSVGTGFETKNRNEMIGAGHGVLNCYQLRASSIRD